VQTRETVFAGFSFTQPPSAVFPSQQTALFTPLLDRVLGVTQLGSQPSRAAVTTELDQLINGIPASNRPGLKNTGADTAARTVAISKAVCAAIIGSASMLVQ
jgi:hypothetical protein